MASNFSYHLLTRSYDWGINGLAPDENDNLTQCMPATISIASVNASSPSINDFFMLSQSPSGLSNFQKLHSSGVDFTYNVTSDEGDVMFTLLDLKGNAGKSYFINVTGGDNSCLPPDPPTVITLKSNVSTGQESVEYCDMVKFQFSGGSKPYGVMFTALNLENSSVINATLGEDDDVFSLPNNFQSVERSSVIVSAFDRNGSWSNSSELLLFDIPPFAAPYCGLGFESSNSVQTSVPISQFSSPSISPTHPTPSISGSSPGTHRPNKTSSAELVAPPVAIILILIVVIVILRRRIKRREENRRFPAVIPDVWSQPNQEQHDTPQSEIDLPSNRKFRNYFDRIIGTTSRRGGREVYERAGQGRQRENTPGPHLFFHVDAESVQEIPPPYRDRIFPIPAHDADSNENEMPEPIVGVEEEQAESAEAQIPSVQLQSLDAPFDQDSEAKNTAAEFSAHDESSRKGEEGQTNELGE